MDGGAGGVGVFGDVNHGYAIDFCLPKKCAIKRRDMDGKEETEQDV